MTQFQHTLRQLLTGDKTETSRIVKPNEYTWICGERPASWNPRGAVKLYSQIISERQTETYIAHRVVWEQDKDYAIQPDRTSKSVGRYRVEAIWRQDVRTLTSEQAKAERVGRVYGMDLGSEWKFNFLQLWAQMHDPKFAFRFDPQITDYRIKLCGEQDIVSWQGLQAIIASRPAERYQAWRMSIRVLWETVDWDAPAVRALQIEPKSVY